MDKLPYREFLAMIQEKAREADIPWSGSFELTPLCNLDCKMCYVHLQDPSVKQRMLSGEQWLSIIQQAIDEGMMEALLTGGETTETAEPAETGSETTGEVRLTIVG